MKDVGPKVSVIIARLRCWLWQGSQGRGSDDQQDHYRRQQSDFDQIPWLHGASCTLGCRPLSGSQVKYRLRTSAQQMETG